MPPAPSRTSLTARSMGSGGSGDEQQTCGGMVGFAVGEQPCEAAAAAQRLVACPAAPRRPNKQLSAAAQVPRPSTPLPPPSPHIPERYSPPVGRLAGPPPPPRPPRERGREELKAAAPRPAPASTAPPWPAASSVRCGGSGRPGIPRSSGRGRGTAPAMLMPLRCRWAEGGGNGGSQRDGRPTVPLPVWFQPPGCAEARRHGTPKVLP